MRDFRFIPGALCGAVLLGLAGCDAVKVPGLNPVGGEETGPPEPAASRPAGGTPAADDSSDATAAPPAADASADPVPGPAPGPAPGPVPGPGPGPGPAPSTTANPAAGMAVSTDPAPAGPAASQPPGAALPPPVQSPAAIGAARCGLPTGAPPTPTLSAQAEALTGPRPESLVMTQAVGALAVSSLTPFPGIVKMEPRRFDGNAITSGHCAATRIAERWFLTAAHCVDDAYDEIQFIAGTTNLRDMASARVFTADAAICHAGYAGRETSFINDLALVRVPEQALPALTEVPIAEYGVTDRPLGQYHYKTAEMAGWGVTGFNQPLSPLLRSAELDIVSTSPGVIVIGSREGAGPCIGDSGGPLYITEDDGQRTVIGILSAVEAVSGRNLCEGAYRGRYTNVTGYRDWIDRVMASCTRQPGLCAAPVSEPAAETVSVSEPAAGSETPPSDAPVSGTGDATAAPSPQ